jgi:adenylate cyclase class IV
MKALVSHVNVEIKAHCADPDAVRRVLISLGAEFQGTDHQVDTYFRVKNGRLKLREGIIENHLIWYTRTDQTGPKLSEEMFCETQPATPIKEILKHSLGVLAVVEKEREIYHIDNVKFHLDVLAGSMSFVEIEAIDYDGTLGVKRLNEQCRHYRDAFKIEDRDLLEGSYSDMIMHRQVAMA